MRRVLVLTLFFCAFACGLYAQAVDTTVCAVLKDPTAFNGKIVRIKGTVTAGFDQFQISDADCGLKVNGIWISYPEGEKIKAGPLAVLQLLPARNFAGKVDATARTPVTLTKDKEFKQFTSLLSTEYKPARGVCLGCEQFSVKATLTGRLDGVGNATIDRDASGKIVNLGGFGNMNAYPARLVLASVADVTPVKVDFSKTETIIGNAREDHDSTQFQYDPIATAQKLADQFGSSPMGLLAQKDVAQYGKGKNANGVSLGYGPINDVSAKENVLGDIESPDGVIYNCTFNQERLQFSSLTLAILHMGQHITDLRTPLPPGSLVPTATLEYNAWLLTSGSAVIEKIKFLQTPGAYMIWNGTWPPATSNNEIIAGLKSFLTEYSHLYD